MLLFLMLILLCFCYLFQKPAVCDGLVNHYDLEQFEKDKEKGEDRLKNEWEHDESLGHRRKSSRRDDCAINQFPRGRKDAASIICKLRTNFLLIYVT